MTTIASLSSPVNLARCQDLTELPDALANDIGTPGISADDLSLLAAHALHLPQVRERLAVTLHEGHFEACEREYWLLLREIFQHADDNGSTCHPEALRASIRRRLEDPQNGHDEDTHLLQAVLSERGLLDQVAAQPVEALSETSATALIGRFLCEREVLGPLRRILQLSQGNGWDSSTRYPAAATSIVRLAAERLDAIDAEWGGMDAWGPPEPLTGPELPSFPVGTLPAMLQQWVVSEATATQTPPDLAAMLALSICSAAAARLLEVEVRPGWLEPINLYTTCAMEPGNRKSAVFADATAPLRAYERDAVEQMRPRVREYESRLDILTARQKHLERSAAKQADEERRHLLIEEALAVRTEIDSLSRVVEPKLLIDDCTVEKLEKVLAEQGERVAVMSPEGGVFAMMGGRYADAPNFDIYLKAHNCEESRTDRLSREAVYLSRPSITMALTVQPDVIHGLGKTKAMRGQGLLARILYTLPQSMLGRRQTNPPPVPEEITQNYRSLVLEICRLFRAGVPSSTLRLHRLTLSAEAATCLEQFAQALEPRLSHSSDLAGIADWAGKLAGEVIRLAAILHLAEQAEQRLCEPEEQRQARIQRRERRPVFSPWETPISGDTLAAATTIAEYLIPHAQAAFAMMGQASNVGAQALTDAWHVVRWIRERGQRAFTRSQLQQQNRSRFRKATDVDPVLDLLEARNIIRPDAAATVGSRGGRPPSQRFLVNPGVFAGEYRCGGEA